MVERQRERNKIEEPTPMAESGDKSGLGEELQAMEPGERMSVARQIDALSEERRQTSSRLPDVEIVLSRDALGAERLEDVLTRAPNDDSSWLKPSTWSGTSEIKGDVYDPDYDRVGHELVHQTCSHIAFRAH